MTKAKNLIAISGKIGSGKDTVASIIEYLTTPEESNEFTIQDYLNGDNLLYMGNQWEIKKFADKLKDIVCILIGCTRRQLEDRDFKEKPLTEEWWYYKITDDVILPRFYYLNKSDNDMCEKRYLVKPSPRLLLQLIGTEAGRRIIHPNVWVNALFSDYVPKKRKVYCDNHIKNLENSCECECSNHVTELPNWLITDTRFPNEAEMVEHHNGVTIRVNANFKRTSEEWQKIKPYPQVLDPDGWDRSAEGWQYSWFDELITEDEYIRRTMFSTCKHNLNDFKNKPHESETALDDYDKWDYVINNDGTLEDLIDKVRDILLDLGFENVRNVYHEH